MKQTFLKKLRDSINRGVDKLVPVTGPTGVTGPVGTPLPMSAILKMLRLGRGRRVARGPQAKLAERRRSFIRLSQRQGIAIAKDRALCRKEGRMADHLAYFYPLSKREIQPITKPTQARVLR